MLSLFSKSVAYSTSRTIFSRKASSLVIIEGEDGNISSNTYSSLNAAIDLQKKDGGNIDAIVISNDSNSLVQEAKNLPNIENLLVRSIDTKNVAEIDAAALSTVLKDSEYTHVFASNSSNAKNIIPRLGALMDIQPITDVVKIESENTFIRPIYAGNAFATVVSKDQKLKIIGVRTTSFENKKPSDSGNANVSEESFDFNGNASEFVSIEKVKSERPSLESARVIFSGGRALKDEKTFEEIMSSLANKVEGSAIGASRAAVDAGFCPNDLQIGQTGKIVAPELYFAIGISGAIQHVAGIKDSKVVVAINKDAEAPIFGIADYGLVGDLYTIIPEMVSKL